jgi:UDP-N-acetylglucosamine 2-epimerase
MLLLCHIGVFQETGNLRYVRSRGFGQYVGQDGEHIADTLLSMLTDDSKRSAMSSRATAYADSYAGLKIARDIALLAE